MKYDFDTVTDRRGTNSLKWDVTEGELPMWVADMDFKTAPEIIEDLGVRLSHGVFGYTEVPEEWYDAYIDWWHKRHDFKMEKDGLIFCTGVIPAISSIVRKLTTPNENVLVQTPVYNIFFNSILNNGCRVSENRLCYNGEEYTVDFVDLEKKLSDPQTTLMILCNPHNPIGKIWDRETLLKIGELAHKYCVTVISDEIHCDITAPDRKYIPFASVSKICAEISVTCIAPTKAFNIAGMQTAAVYASNPVLRHKVWRALNTDEVAEPNSFAVTAAVSAFTKGGEWLDELRSYLFDNRLIAEDFIKKEIPSVKAVKGEATYLLWVDISGICDDAEVFCKFLRKETGLYVSAGNVYGESGNKFLRLNLACPRSVLKDGLERLKKGAGSFKDIE